jgi:outer membrane immunogenic protein
MKKAVLIALALTTLVASPPFAADLSRPAPAYKALPPPPAPIFTWTGFYLGGNLGGAWAQRDITDRLYGLTWGSGSSNAVFIGGGQAGFNYQFGGFVLGVEGDFDWAANSHNSAAIVVPAVGAGDLIQITSNNRWIGTLAARFGVAFNNVLLYGKAGGGWVGNNGFTATDLTTGTSITGFNNDTRSGWLAGAGTEWAFAHNWTVKFEYDYLGLGSRTIVVPAGAPFLVGDTFTLGRNVQEVKVGFNYLFNWGGSARY